MLKIVITCKGLRLYLLCIIILFWCRNAKAQNKITFNHINVENGLSQSSVIAIDQDNYGYLWFGTKYGLNKYNGTNFKIYKNNPVDERTIGSSDFIGALLCDNKKNLWVGTLNGLDKYNPQNDSFEHIKRFKLTNYIFQDSKGAIWVGTYTGVFYSTDRKHLQFKKFDFKIPSLNNKTVRTIYEDHQKNIWIGTTDGLIKLTWSKGNYTSHLFGHNNKEISSLSDNYVTTITEDNHQRLWVGTRYGGLNLYNDADHTFKHFSHSAMCDNCLINNSVRKLLMDKNGQMWIGTQDGLSILDVDHFTFTSYQHDPADPNSLSQNSIYDIFQDVYGSIWIGTYFGGVNVVYAFATPFNIYQNDHNRNSISSNVVSTIFEDNKHNLWIGTEAEGINYFDRGQDKFTSYKNIVNNTNSLSSNLVKSIFADKSGIVWIGTSRDGMDRFDKVNHTFKHYKHDPNNPGSLSSNNIVSIFQDSEGRFWVGTESGLNRFYPDKDKFENYNTKSLRLTVVNDTITTIYEDSKKNLWVGTSAGIDLLQNGSSSFKYFVATGRNGLNSGRINCIKEDSRGMIWIGTYHGGLSYYNPVTSKFNTYTEKDGLPSSNILGILEDDQQHFWVSTDNGLSRFNPQSNTFRNYNTQDGLPSNEFNNSSYLKDNKGEMFFGGYNGMVSFFPSQIKENPYPPKIVLTGLKLFNKPVYINAPDHLLKQDISVTNAITFSYFQNVITFDFAALNYIKSIKNKYAYKLEGFEKDWNFVDVPSATYTNLSSGTYTLLIKGSNNDGVWNTQPTRLLISVMPPPWKTWWAYLGYFTLFALSLYYVIRFFRIRAKLESDLYHEHRELEQQQQMYQMRLNFFTNVSHEIRTPLTLILGPIEKLLNIMRNDESGHRSLLSIKNNTDRLYRLVNELLDFRKVESGNFKLYVSQDNIVKFIKEIYLSFQSIALSKEIQYEFITPEDNIPLYFDKDQLEKVFFNLISNAFKFTPVGGQIVVEIKKDLVNEAVEVVVQDNGQGIPYESLDKIFENFYQMSNPNANSIGTGIGLALSKGIVELHKGKISVESRSSGTEKEGFTRFRVLLKSGSSHFQKDELITEELQGERLAEYTLHTDPDQAIDYKENNKSVDPANYTLLLIEDNDEVRDFIKRSLEDNYNIIECSNGLDGWEVAIKIIPDMVISDVMMPVMDGLELCRKLKTDNRTCHIPVILLTARSAYIHQVNGLQTGADAYITKPFSNQILHLNIQNMLALKKAMQKRFSQHLLLGPREFIDASADEKLLDKLVSIIEMNLSNADFCIADLTIEIGMSKSALYKKFNALTNLSLTEFIKNQRLKHAALLLQKGKYTVADISFLVGFNDSKYFSKEFRKIYGITPNEYLKQEQEK